MASEFPGRPTLIKGALAVFPTHTSGARPSHVIVYQYNPEQMKRTLAHRVATAPAGSANTGTAKEDTLRVAGPPVETISITVDMHAADQLDEPDAHPDVAAAGLHP